MTLRTVLLSLQALLAAAEPDDPQDAVVANQVGVLVPLVLLHLQDVSQCSSGGMSTHEWDLLQSVTVDSFHCTHTTWIDPGGTAVTSKNYPNGKCVHLSVICVYEYFGDLKPELDIDTSPMCLFNIVQYKIFKYDYGSALL